MSEASITVLTNHLVFEARSPVHPESRVKTIKDVFGTTPNVLPISNVSEAKNLVLPIYIVFGIRTIVAPGINTFEPIDVVLPINNVSEAMCHVLPIYVVPAARTETDVLGPKKGGILAFGGVCGRENYSIRPVLAES